MFHITVAVGSAAWGLLFKTEEAARMAEAQLTQAELNQMAMGANAPRRIRITDDFGQTMSAESDKIAGFLFEDLDRSKLAHVERALHNQHTQQAANKAAEADPGIRAAMAVRGGPPLITPFNGGGH